MSILRKLADALSVARVKVDVSSYETDVGRRWRLSMTYRPWRLFPKSAYSHVGLPTEKAAIEMALNVLESWIK
jgi:hypothetical protein